MRRWETDRWGGLTDEAWDERAEQAFASDPALRPLYDQWAAIQGAHRVPGGSDGGVPVLAGPGRASSSE